MAKRHDQRSYPPDTVCHNCKASNCRHCVDVPRVALGLYDTNGPLCFCRKAMHGGEAVTRQVVDPETGTVYGPALSVTIDGEVSK